MKYLRENLKITIHQALLTIITRVIVVIIVKLKLLIIISFWIKLGLILIPQITFFEIKTIIAIIMYSSNSNFELVLFKESLIRIINIIFIFTFQLKAYFGNHQIVFLWYTDLLLFYILLASGQYYFFQLKSAV